MSATKYLFPAVALALILAACSSKPQWVKPGTGSDVVSDDLAESNAVDAALPDEHCGAFHHARASR